MYSPVVSYVAAEALLTMRVCLNDDGGEAYGIDDQGVS